jgi:hypothetical protein
MGDDIDEDPYGETSPQNILRHLFRGSDSNPELPF